MRTVFNNRELCHVWASKKQATGRGSNLFFEGNSIYSYGHHFEIARHVEHNGKSAVLFTTESYSNTTAKHKNDVCRSINHLATFHVPLVRSSRYSDPVADPQFFFASYVSRIDELIVKAAKARTYKEWHLKQARNLALEGNELAKFFGVENRITLPENFDAMLAEAKAAESIRIAKKAEETKRRNEENRRKAIEALEQWRAGTIYSLPYSHTLESDYLRMSADRQTIQTSRGATVPMEHAERAYRIMAKLQARHEAYQRNGHTFHVGHYAIDRMDEAGTLNIGCHTIRWEEIERIANQANWRVDHENDNADNAEHARHETNHSGQNEDAGNDEI